MVVLENRVRIWMMILVKMKLIIKKSINIKKNLIPLIPSKRKN
jgi:hypothetical protein